jgi:hypothetical protein
MSIPVISTLDPLPRAERVEIFMSLGIPSLTS